MPPAESDPQNTDNLNNEASEPSEAPVSQEQTIDDAGPAELPVRGEIASAPADQITITTAEPAPSDEPGETPTQVAAGADEEREPKFPLSQRQSEERASGGIFWLTLGIGALGLLLMFLLPWVHIYYPNTMQAIQGFQFQTFQFPKDELVSLSMRGSELLTSNFWQLLVLFILAALLLAATIYWWRTRFAQVRVAWVVLGLALLVGIGFPVELRQLLVAPQRVEWSNDQATIQDNKDPLRNFDSNATVILFPCPPNQAACNKDYIRNSLGLVTFILSDELKWVEISNQHVQLVQGDATSTRASQSSPDVTTSGYASASFSNLNPGIGYWGAWVFSLWILINALFLLRRLWSEQRPSPNPWERR